MHHKTPRVLRLLLPAWLAWLAWLAWPAGGAAAADLLLVQASRLVVFEETAEAFRRSLPPAPRSGPKRAIPYYLEEVVLTDAGAPRALARRLRSTPPRLVVAIGTAALAAMRDFPRVPVVHLLVPEPEAVLAGRTNAVGLPLEVPAGPALAALLEVAPRVRRVGVLYDPKRTGGFATAALDAARTRGLTLLLVPAASAAEAVGLLPALAGRVDALWMFPDTTVTTPDTVDALARFALEQRLPILSFAEKYLARGATVAVVRDPATQAAEAASLAVRLLEGDSPPPPDPLSALRTRVNRAAAQKLGLLPAEGPR